MWNDIETSKDYLHFSVVSRAVADIIVESGKSPISIGVSGSWGSGKSSMVKMIGQDLKKRDESGNSYIFLEFNAWLYQGYDDARSALLQSVSQKLSSEMERRKIPNDDSAWDKLKRFSKRINWFQVSKLAIPLFAGLIPGVNAVGAIGGLISAISNSIENPKDVTANSDAVDNAYEKLAPEVKNLLKTEATKPATEQIEELRTEFKELLEKLNVKLVVLVDDLDRCLPETAVLTLEAMRLLLFVDRTAFIIAADEQMIRNGVRAHFGDVELSEGLVTSYFDKLIQVPITVPRLGVAEIKVYIVLLYIEAEIRRKNLDSKILTDAQEKLNELLARAWQASVTKETIEEALKGIGMDGLSEYISIADQIAGILATADNIKGNPRLIKRFMNALEIRKKIAKFNGITVDPGILIKMLLFERCASVGAFDYLTQKVLQDENGKPGFIKELEDSVTTGNEYKAPDTNWESDFIKKWLLLPPSLAGMDLRPLIYLSKDRPMPYATYDELSPEGKKILEALKAVKNGPTNQDLVKKIKGIGETESTLLLNQIARIGRGNQWNVDTVCAATHITEAYPSIGDKLALALSEIPSKSVKPAMVVLIKEKEWAKKLLDKWLNDPETPKQTKNAIAPKSSRI
jgi:predicted KAP-like P-loop ATPase